MDAFSARQVSVRYDSRMVVHAVDLVVSPGTVSALIGANGAGKTSLLEASLGLRPLASGFVQVAGLPVPDALQRGLVGVMLQQGGVPANAKAHEWLAHVARIFAATGTATNSFPDRWAQTPAAARGFDRLLDHLLDRLGIDPRGRVPFKRLSGGEQQRVRLAAALLAPSALVILDEPSAGLDPLIRREVLAMIGEHRDAGVGVLLTTHRMDEIEGLCTTQDQVLVMAQGRIVEQGTVAELTGTGTAIRLILDSSVRLTAGDLGDLRSVLHSELDPPVAAGAPIDVESIRVDGPVPDARGQRVTVHVSASPQALAQVLSWCADRGLVPIEIRTEARSLDEVLDTPPEST